MTYLILEDGTVFQGKNFGAKAPTINNLCTNKATGELIFNTSMVGYQEILSDPSYTGQIVTFTYPHIGNYGIEKNKEENILKKKLHVNSLVVKEYYSGPLPKGRISLNQYLIDNDIVGLCEVDTRSLTLKLRDEGFKRAVIIDCENLGKTEKEIVIKHLKAFPFISNLNTVEKVSTKKIIHNPIIKGKVEILYQSGKHFAVIDFGIKSSIIKELYKRGVEITLFPPNVKKEEIEIKKFDTLFLSNGPGDPENQTDAINLVKSLQGTLPIAGICLGHQIITLALGGKTEKMAFGHHGGNQPVTEIDTGRTFVTSQNHSFVSTNLPDDCKIWFKNSNDGSIEGLKNIKKNILSVQFHPEAGPGPEEGQWIFDEFIKGAR